MTKRGRPTNRFIYRKKQKRQVSTYIEFDVYDKEEKRVVTSVTTKAEAIELTKKMNKGETENDGT